MKETRVTIWKAILEQSRIMMEKDSLLVMYTDSEALFHQNFNYYYSLISDKFMKIKNEHLDRHKIASIIICAILKSDILGIVCGQNSSQTIDDIFLANEKLALNIALSDMHQRLQQDYKIGKIPYDGLFADFVFPRPLSCDREYTEVICRDLYFAKKYFELDPLSIANFLFLLEAFSFEASRININVDEWERLKDIRHKEQYEKELQYINSSLNELKYKYNNEKVELENKRDELQNSLKKIAEES